jgi:hypothetical protein
MSSDNADSSGSSSSSSSSCGYAAWQPAPLPLAQAVAARLLQEAYNRGSMDNLALVVLDLQPSTAGGGRLQRPDTTAVAQQGATATTGAPQHCGLWELCHLSMQGAVPSDPETHCTFPASQMQCAQHAW